MATKKVTTIKSISTSVNLHTGATLVLGLGDDNRVYAWSAEAGLWVPNWRRPVPAAQKKPAQRSKKK